jgi:hypothetical protein
MGFKLKLPKIKISAPKITADPMKLVNSATKALTDVTGNSIGAVGTIANQSVSAVGSVLSNPAAAPILGAAGASLGIPGVGEIASAFASKTEATPPAVAEQPTQFFASSDSGNNKDLLLYGGIAGGVLLLIISIFIFKKGKG